MAITSNYQNYQLGSRSRRNLRGVDPRLITLTETAIGLTTQDFTVIEGVRSPQRQRELYRQGLSWTLNSKHLTGHAVDLAPWVMVGNGGGGAGRRGTIDWNDLSRFDAIADAMFAAARTHGIRLRWGGDWNGNGQTRDEHARGTYDGAHFELMDID